MHHANVNSVIDYLTSVNLGLQVSELRTTLTADRLAPLTHIVRCWANRSRTSKFIWRR